MSEQKPKQPKIREFSVRESDEYYRARRRLMLANDELQAFMDAGKNDLEKLEQLEKASEVAAQNLRGVIAKVIISVPREWLTEDAPEKIDWSDSDNMDYLKFSKVALISSIAQGNLYKFEDEEKN